MTDVSCLVDAFFFKEANRDPNTSFRASRVRPGLGGPAYLPKIKTSEHIHMNLIDSK